MKFWRKLHKWIACLIGIQILLWISGGVVMSAFPIENVRGKHLLLPTLKQNLKKPVVTNDISLSKWQSLSWTLSQNNWVLEAVNIEGQTYWLNPSTGKPAPYLTQANILALAESRHAKGAKAKTVINLKTIPFEVRHLNLPMYQVNFDDWIHTSFYIYPQSGKIVSVRSDIWRLYDFFWMLHIMDYQDREDFNHPLLIGAAGLSLLFTLTGLILVYFSVLKPWYAKLKYRKRF
ncbi:hypothetical protein [uncultured Paraglaciecola sp.]|uniref:hypothetical protein n=1 Tax=uncultured Paraglaciecola sp. TaxID=1765024 RepID=UPI002599F22D|nr:hypothetical protein [uncultured Paraglaciecola sp.]